MQFGITVPNFGVYADPRLTAELAHEAEEVGWDGFFLWDHMIWTWPQNFPVADPYVMLAAMAMTTSRIKLGPLVTPIARRRPWKMARELTTLDQLTGGRIVLGAGIGGDWFGDYSAFGEPADDKSHAEMLDEGLQVLMGLWSGKPFSFEGKRYKVKEVQLLPRPVQQPRIPIWIAGKWPNKKPFRRAAQWDGVFPISADDEKELTVEEVRDLVAYTKAQRTVDGPFDIVMSGRTSGKDAAKAREHVAPYVEAGLTWWLEGLDWSDTLEEVQERIRSGPPRV